LRLALDQTLGSRLTLAVNGDVIHTAADRGLFDNENNGASLQAALSSMPSFIDYRAQCPDGSMATNLSSVCAGATWPSTAPYAFSNPFQTVALFRSPESVWRSVLAAHANWDVVVSPRHTLRFVASGGGDILTQKNSVDAPPDLQFQQISGL